ncbi:protein MIS12 homolog isoform X1 [Dendrobates tinctorius]|uniref:protein MIS12 homolog isoform X1 n=1 Tax=Dendrobates tinctorius TaxID=92724 RepID=UPI003CC9BEEC
MSHSLDSLLQAPEKKKRLVHPAEPAHFVHSREPALCIGSFTSDTSLDRKALCAAEYEARFLATGESLSSLHFQYRLGISTISGIVKYTCRALWDSLAEEFLPEPTTERWIEIADKFQQICQFPNCLGAVDGKHIRIVKLAGSGSEYFNYKKYFSIVLMAIADAEYKFIAVDIGAYGRSNDSQVFKLSAMGRKLYGNTFQFPPPRPLPQTSGPPMPFVCVGDEAFQLSEHLLKPYSSRGLTRPKRIFNYRLTRARRMVECTFGILTAKWRVLLTAINLKTETVDEVIKACVVLHNFVICKEPISIEDTSEETTLQDYHDITTRSSVTVSVMRDNFALYFMSPQGRVHWQDDRV